MTIAKPLIATLLCAAMLAVTTSPSSAQMGGGMGMGSSSGPSQASPQAAYQAGVAALQAHDYPEAIRQFRLARRASPGDGNINYALGLSLAGGGDKQGARGAFQQAVRARNAPAGAWLQLGLVALELGDRANAVEQQEALQQAVSSCDAACGDARRLQLQTAYDQLTRALATPATATP